MVPQPETHYVKSPERNIAYQVFGDGPIHLVIVPGWLSHVDLLWQEPGWVTLMSELTSAAIPAGVLTHASVDGLAKQVGVSGVTAVLLDQVAEQAAQTCMLSFGRGDVDELIEPASRHGRVQPRA
jgi:hypothetical protein